MTDYQRFSFDTVFDQQGNVIATPSPRPRTRFSKDELEQARSDGVAEGQANAEAQAAQASAAALAEIAQGLATLLGTLTAETDRLTVEARSLTFETTRMIAGRLIDEQPADHVCQLIEDCLATLHKVPRVIIHVAPTIAGRIEEGIQQAARTAGFEGQVEIEPREGLAQTTCHLDWGDGGAAASFEQSVEKIRHLIQDDLAAAQNSQLDLFETLTASADGDTDHV